MPTMTTALRCPRDHEPLALHTEPGRYWHACTQCKGVFVALATTPTLKHLTQQLIERAADWPRSSTGCPQCHGVMHLTLHEGIEIDVCRHCRAVWLDTGEMESFDQSCQTEKEHPDADGMAQREDAARKNDGSGSELSDALDWLGDALGGLLSS